MVSKLYSSGDICIALQSENAMESLADALAAKYGPKPKKKSKKGE